MKKRLIITCLAVFYCVSLFANSFEVQNYLGINCITYQIGKQESFYQVAQRFFVRPSTLVLVNGISDIDEITDGQQLFIPLTETNFYQTKGVASSKFGFEQVYYKIVTEKELSEIAKEFYVTTGKLKSWNENLNSNSVTQGQNILVGWVKMELEEKTNSAPRFIQNEKIVYGNNAEKMEAKELIQNADISKSGKRFPDYSIPEKSLPIEKPTIISSSTRKKVVASKAKTVTIKKVSTDKTEKKVVKKIDESSTPTQLTKLEIEYLADGKKNNTESNKPSPVVKSLQKITRNSYSRNKAKQREVIAQRKADHNNAQRKEEARKLALFNKSNVDKKRIAKEAEQNEAVQRKAKQLRLENMKLVAARAAETEAKQKTAAVLQEKQKSEMLLAKKSEEERIIKNKEQSINRTVERAREEILNTEKVISKAEIIDKSDKKNGIKKSAEVSDDPLYLENKLQRLALLKSTNGSASFFYAGTAGAKFYVFTNLANKGGIIKVTNLTNGRYILAEVIGSIPEEDRKRGFIIKLSDNAKLLLQANGKHFSAKVNY